MATYEIKLVWSMAGGLVYSPPDPPSLWLEDSRRATTIPYAILLATLSRGRFPGEALGAEEPSEPHGWFGEAYLPEGEAPWGSELWAYFGEVLTDGLPGLLASAVAKSLVPLQTIGLLGAVDVQAERDGDRVPIVIGFERPQAGGERFSELWDAYLETREVRQHG